MAVTVTAVDEDGEVVISWLQPEVHDETNADTNTVIMASLTDPDGEASPTWAWGSLRNSSG